MMTFSDRLVVLGVDPGIWTLGACVLTDGRISWAEQLSVKQSKRKDGKLAKEQRIEQFSRLMADAQPNVVAIEDVEYQPWVAGGKIPKGMVALQELVTSMKELVQLHGLVLYVQSPGIQKEYEDAHVTALLRKAFPTAELSQHLMSATKHALYADSFHRRVRGQHAQGRADV